MYQSLTTAERLYLEYIISEYSLRGSFYKSDLEVAVTLGVSEDKVRRARRRVGRPTDYAVKVTSVVHCRPLAVGIGWIIYTPGWQNGTRNLATRYNDVPIAKVQPGDFFASVHRFTFEVLLSYIRRNLLTHADVAMWLVLSYKYWRCRGKTEDHHFFITKREFIRLSGIANAPSCVRHLYEVVVFSDGKHLFEWLDWSQRLAFSQWTWSSDPSKNEPTARLQETRRRELAEQVLAQKQLMQEGQQSTRRCRLGIRP